MNKPIIYIHQTLRDEQLQEIINLAPHYDVRYGRQTIDLSELDQIEISFGWNREFEEPLLSSPTSRLKWIQLISAGVDYMPLDRLAKKNILLSNGSGIHSIPIAESVIGMLLAYARGIQPAIRSQEKGQWLGATPYTELYGKSMLIVGTGQIGKRLATVSQALGLEVSGVNRSGRPVEGFNKTYPQSEIDTLLPKSDIVVNILPLTSETTHFYNRELFSKMKTGVLFINVGRGPSVKTDDLIAAIKNKKIAFAGLDVFEEEPLSRDSPLWQMEEVLLTPHISGQSADFKHRIHTIFTENLSAYLASQQLVRNQIDLALGY